MAGTQEGGYTAAQTNVEKYGPDFYPRIGAIGGRNGHTGGFAGRPDLASKWGKIGGAISRRDLSETTKKPRQVTKAKAKAQTTLRCTFCYKPGHKAYSCPTRREYLTYKQQLRSKKAYQDELDDIERQRMARIARRFQ